MEVLDWNLYFFNFITNFRPTLIDIAGTKDFVYQITLKDESATKGFQGFWGSEPFNSNTRNSVVRWDIDHVRFHYPAEHTFNGTRHDLEMQIFHKVSSILLFTF